MDELWNLMWSRRQNAFHIEQLRYTMERNLSAFAVDARTDYVTLYVGTADDCHAMADRLRPSLAQNGRIREICDDIAQML